MENKTGSSAETSVKVGKYFKYAIGEIILVVIGILIALQVNNWNEARKNAKIELEFLKNLDVDLQKDLDNLKYKIEIDSMIMESNKFLLNAIRNNDSKGFINKVTFENSEISGNALVTLNRAGVFYPQKFAYESLKDRGIDLIENDSLRQHIVNLYDYRYETLSDFLKFQWNQIVQTNPYLFQHLETTTDSLPKKIPNNFDSLINDAQFYNFLSHMYYENINALKFYTPCLDDLIALSEMVKKEIQIKER